MKLWRVRGFVAQLRSEWKARYITVEAPDGRPTLLETSPVIYDYLMGVSNSDMEEKYMNLDFLYNGNCDLIAVLVPGPGDVPAKAVVLVENGLRVETYGQNKIIDSQNPAAMSREEWNLAREAFVQEGWSIKECLTSR